MTKFAVDCFPNLVIKEASERGDWHSIMEDRRKMYNEKLLPPSVA
jgi:hypothetical protein